MYGHGTVWRIAGTRLDGIGLVLLDPYCFGTKLRFDQNTCCLIKYFGTGWRSVENIKFISVCWSHGRLVSSEMPWYLLACGVWHYSHMCISLKHNPLKCYDTVMKIAVQWKMWLCVFALETFGSARIGCSSHESHLAIQFLQMSY